MTLNVITRVIAITASVGRTTPVWVTALPPKQVAAAANAMTQNMQCVVWGAVTLNAQPVVAVDAVLIHAVVVRQMAVKVVVVVITAVFP